MLKSVRANSPIHSITKFTTLDYPQHLACIFWFAKCNMRCSYCYNPKIVDGQGTYSIEEALTFLESRRGRLEGVVLSGGECTLYPHLSDFCVAIKAMGFKIKIDTNGSNPTLLSHLLENRLVDYIAFDYKAPKHLYEKLARYRNFEPISQSLNNLLQHSTPFEVRTTWHSDLLSKDDINTIIEDLHERGYKGTYFLQHYLHVNETLGGTKEEQSKASLRELHTFLPIELRNF